MKSILLFSKTHPFFATSIFLSILLGFLPFVIYLTIEELRWIAFVFLIPIGFVALVCFFALKTQSRKPIVTNIIASLLNILIIFFVQIYLFGLSIVLIAWCSGGSFDSPKDYKKAKSKIERQEYIKHFPAEIPANAKDIQLHQSYGSWFGSEGITLKFKANKDYIKNELSKYRYKKIINHDSNNVHESFEFYTDNGRISANHCKEYIIDFEKYKYGCGICVNINQNEIIYYYSYPD